MKWCVLGLCVASVTARAEGGRRFEAGVDAYLARPKAAASSPSPAPKTPESSATLTAIETKVRAMVSQNDVDYAAWLRLDTFLDARKKAIREAKGQNVYDDKVWAKPIRRDLTQLCCMIQNNFSLAEAIRKRVKAKMRPLPHGVQDNSKLAAAFANPPTKP